LDKRGGRGGFVVRKGRMVGLEIAKVVVNILLKIILLCLSFYLVDILLNVMIHLVCCEKLRLEIVIK
jgi:hypothetical protein